jgi:O-antigen/teichoic acid export membrane protein
MMRRLRALLRQSEFHIFLFCLSLILFARPLLVMFNGRGPESVFISLYVPWAVIIFFLFLAARSSASAPADQSRDGETGE